VAAKLDLAMELDVAAGGGGAAAVTLEAAADAEAERARAFLTVELCTELALEVWLQLGRTLGKEREGKEQTREDKITQGVFFFCKCLPVRRPHCHVSFGWWRIWNIGWNT